MKSTIYVITRKPRGTRTTRPVCWQPTRKDADLYVKMLREDEGKTVTFGVTPLRRGAIEIDTGDKA